VKYWSDLQDRENNKYFRNLTNHFMDQKPLSNHLLQLIRLIIYNNKNSSYKYKCQ
jgi:hypothetical protein